MSGRRLAGVFAPITTPFDAASGEVAAAHLRRNVTRLLEAGLDGVLVAGSSGEAALLDPEEQQRLVTWAREAVPADKWLIVGTGAESTRQAIAATRAAAAAGADLVLVRPPSYYGELHAPASLGAHFRAVADASPVPVLVYNIPKYTRMSLEADLIAELTGHPRIVGAKQSSGDVRHLAAYREAAPAWSVLAGSGSALFAGLELGCEGGVVAVACFAARQCAELYAAFRAGDRARAGALQERLGALDKAIVGKHGPAGIKAAMDAAGLYGGPTRPPLTPLDAADRERVAHLVCSD